MSVKAGSVLAVSGEGVAVVVAAVVAAAAVVVAAGVGAVAKFASALMKVAPSLEEWLVAVLLLLLLEPHLAPDQGPVAAPPKAHAAEDWPMAALRC